MVQGRDPEIPQEMEIAQLWETMSGKEAGNIHAALRD